MTRSTHRKENRREFIKILSGGAAAGPFFLRRQANASTEAPRPNIVLIMADDLGYECIGAYKGTSYETPNLDRLAKTGMRFDYAHSCPKCVPSRVCILTGRYGFRNYIGWGEIPDDEITFGHVLSSADYATALAGKWQLALLKEEPHHVTRMGFQKNCCWAWHEGSRYYQPMIYQNGDIIGNIEDEYGPDVYCDFLIDFMKENRDQQFLAYYPAALTHFPKTGGPYKEPPGPDGEHKSYKEMVEYLDRLVGRIEKSLDELGLRENTLILFTGDNGTPKRVTSLCNGKEIQGGKGTLTDAGTRVPLIANWKGVIPPGSVCDDLIDFSDFLPTFAELAGAELPEDRIIDGHSFAYRLLGAPGEPREWIYTQWQGKSWVRTHRWKLYDDGRLYDLKNDKMEENPIPLYVQSDEAAAVRKRLKGVFKSLREGNR